MPKPERGSLNVVKRALPNLAAAAPPKELEERLLGGDDRGDPEIAGHGGFGVAGSAVALQPAIEPDVQLPDVQRTDILQPTAILHPSTPATRLTPRPGKRKEPVQMVTYRIPASLYDRLFRTAEYNNLNMTDIVVEAIERHLPNFPPPPVDAV